VVEAIPALHYPVDLTSGRSGHRAAHTHTRTPRATATMDEQPTPPVGDGSLRLTYAEIAARGTPACPAQGMAADHAQPERRTRTHKSRSPPQRRATTFPAEPATEQGLSVSYAKMQCIACMCNAPYPVPS
jgi:hypothetical protein